jgi:hypothetical protein
VSAPTRGEVVKRLRDLQPAIAQGITPASDRLTVAQYLNGWVTDRIPGTITTRTEELYARAVKVYINPSIGKIRLNRLTPSHVSAMLQDLEARGYAGDQEDGESDSATSSAHGGAGRDIDAQRGFDR